MPRTGDPSNNPNGRPKGSLSKKTKIKRTTLSEFIQQEMDHAMTEFHELSLKDRLLMLNRFMPFTLPRYHTVDILREMQEERLQQDDQDRTVANILKKILTEEQKKQLQIEAIRALPNRLKGNDD